MSFFFPIPQPLARNNKQVESVARRKTAYSTCQTFRVLPPCRAFAYQMRPGYVFRYTLGKPLYEHIRLYAIEQRRAEAEAN